VIDVGAHRTAPRPWRARARAGNRFGISPCRFSSYDEYLPFGGVHQPGTNVTVEQRYTYTGREKNPASALMYYRYRQYDPRVGRFGERDPIGHAQGNRLYTYAGGDPVSWRDAFGALRGRLMVHREARRSPVEIQDIRGATGRGVHKEWIGRVMPRFRCKRIRRSPCHVVRWTFYAHCQILLAYHTHYVWNDITTGGDTVEEREESVRSHEEGHHTRFKNLYDGWMTELGEMEREIYLTKWDCTFAARVKRQEIQQYFATPDTQH
jgi:RHS repeat-associated protein